MINLKELDKYCLDDFVKDIFIGFLQTLFFENPGEFHYDPEEGKSKLIITDRFSYNNLEPDFKPIIYTRRRPMGFMNTSIDQMQSMNLNTGSKTYTDLITGTMELVCVSRVDLEASRLGGIVFLLVQEFKDKFRGLGMHDVAVKALGEVEIKKARSIEEIVEVPVTVQYTFQYSWMTGIMNSTLLKDVVIANKGSLIKDPDDNYRSGSGCVPINL